MSRAPSPPTIVAEMARLRLRVNGEQHEILAPLNKTLLEVLREELGLTGTKHGCELGECGACTVLIDGDPILSCLTLPIEVQERDIETVEGLAQNARLHELQEAFAELGASQCGYCSPGMLMSAKALLERVELPDREQIREGLAGNLCRCTGYLQIIEAVEAAARRRHAAADTGDQREKLGAQGGESGEVAAE